MSLILMAVNRKKSYENVAHVAMSARPRLRCELPLDNIPDEDDSLYLLVRVIIVRRQSTQWTLFP